MSRLGQSSAEISGVLALIGSIASQTNLLALNATIEAARAGDYGRGFAVVAHEVKELAQQSAAATEDIGRKIAGMQEAATGAVEALGRMQAVTLQISDHQGTIAAAVEQQTATAAQMTQSLASAAAGSGSIAGTIQAVAGAAQRATGSATRTGEVAQTVAHVSSSFEQELTAFAY